MFNPLVFSVTTTILSLIGTLFAGTWAFLSYQLSCKIRDELKSDEDIVASRFIHPNLNCTEHRNSVIACTVFNKSKRKAFIDSVKVFDLSHQLVKISYSNKIDTLGNTLLPCGLIGIVDSEEIYIRRNDGESFSECSVAIYHSFPNSPKISGFKIEL